MYRPNILAQNVYDQEKHFKHRDWRPSFRPRGTFQPGFRGKFTGKVTESPFIDNSDGEHWCETCDRSFRTKDLLESHKLQHQKCNIDGCQFVAHPKVITKHIQMQHSSGLYNKIAKLDNPEAIKKWREERKSKFPTRENIEKKTAKIKEKIDRGEKMGLKQMDHKRTKIFDNKMDRCMKRKHSFGNGNYSKQHVAKHSMSKRRNLASNEEKSIPKTIPKVLPTTEDNRKLKPFTGILNLHSNSDVEEIEEECHNYQIEDIDDETDSKQLEDEQVVKPVVCSALSYLMCTYESSDEDPVDDKGSGSLDQSNENLFITNNKKEEIRDLIQQIEGKTKDANKEHLSDDDSGPEEVKIDKEITTDKTIDKITVSKEATVKKRFNNKMPFERHTFQRPKPKLPSTLLEKLLFKEIRQERNVILQCIRHIVKNNHFDKT